MALDVYVQKDVLNALRSVYFACEGTSENALAILREHAPLEQDVELIERQALDEKMVGIYRLGFNNALSAVALAFGLVQAEEGKVRSGSPWRLPDGRS